MMMSSKDLAIQQLQELMGDIVDSGSSSSSVRIPRDQLDTTGPWPPHALGSTVACSGTPDTTETCPVVRRVTAENWPPQVLDSTVTCPGTPDTTETCPVVRKVLEERYPRLMGTTDAKPSMHDFSFPQITRTEKCQLNATHTPLLYMTVPSQVMNGTQSSSKVSQEPNQNLGSNHSSLKATIEPGEVIGDTHSSIEAVPGPNQVMDGTHSSSEVMPEPNQVDDTHSSPEVIPEPCQLRSSTHSLQEVTLDPSPDMVNSTNHADDFSVEVEDRVPRGNTDVSQTCHTELNTIKEISESPPIQQTIPNDSNAEPHYLNDDQMPQPHRDSSEITTPTAPQTPIMPPSDMQPEIPPPYQSNPNTPEVYRGICRFHQNMPSPYHSHPNTPGISRVPCHRFTHTFEDDSYSLNSTLTSLEVAHLQLTARPCHIASSSLESQFRLPVKERGLFLQDAVFERAAPVLQSALREVLGRGWGPGRHTTMADEMVRYRNMRAGDMDGRTQVAVITRHDTYYLIVVDMHEYLEGSIQLKVGGCCSILVEGWMEMEDGDELVTYDFSRRFPTPDMAELKDISADLSSDGILCIIVPTIPLDELCYSPGPQYNDSNYEPLVDVGLHSQKTKAIHGRPGDNINPRYGKYWHDSHHQDPSLQPLVDGDSHGHNTTASTVRLEANGEGER